MRVEPNEWTDFSAMIEDVRRHVREVGRPMELFDDPMQRTLGYCDPEILGRDWWIHLTNVKASLNTAADAERDVLTQAVKTPEGRLRLVNG